MVTAEDRPGTTGPPSQDCVLVVRVWQDTEVLARILRVDAPEGAPRVVGVATGIDGICAAVRAALGRLPDA